jgi:nicotinamide-nucleotide amidase
MAVRAMKAPRVELVCVGSELLMGKVNTHPAALARELEPAGLGIDRETVVADNARDMADAFAQAWRRADIVLCTGGLGPTFDDITRDVWARVLRRPLRLVPSLLQDIQEKFQRRGLRPPPENRRQAFVLSGARPLSNLFGTAPGQVLAAGKKTLALLPGPAREMLPMVRRDLVPFLQRVYPGLFRRTEVYRIFGIPESVVDHRLRPIVARERKRGRVSVTWGILAHGFVVDIKVTVAAPAPAALESRLRALDSVVRRAFGRDIYGFGEETLQEVVGRELARRGLSLSLAESCTGGLLAQKITAVSGSSAYFVQGFVTYANGSKTRLLGVKAATLRKFGAVSRSCALEMARGCRKRSGTDFALAVTGIAGPSGGTPERPVGLVFLALASRSQVQCVQKRFFGDRDQIRERAALAALDLLRRDLIR